MDRNTAAEVMLDAGSGFGTRCCMIDSAVVLPLLRRNEGEAGRDGPRGMRVRENRPQSHRFGRVVWCDEEAIDRQYNFVEQLRPVYGMRPGLIVFPCKCSGACLFRLPIAVAIVTTSAPYEFIKLAHEHAGLFELRAMPLEFGRIELLQRRLHRHHVGLEWCAGVLLGPGDEAIK